MCFFVRVHALHSGAPRFARRNRNKFNTNFNKFDLSLICSGFVLIFARQGTHFPARARSSVFRNGTRCEVIHGDSCVQAGRRPAQGQRPCQGLRPFLLDENSTGHAILQKS